MLKSRNLIIFFFLFLSIEVVFSVEQDKVHCGNIKGSKYDVSNLMFAGMPFPNSGDAKCIQANGEGTANMSEADASSQCKGMGSNAFVITPTNVQYQPDNAETNIDNVRRSRFGRTGGETTENTGGPAWSNISITTINHPVYWCFPNSGNVKANVCSQQNADREMGGKLLVRYVRDHQTIDANSGNVTDRGGLPQKGDGDCYCKQNGSTDQWLPCNNQYATKIKNSPALTTGGTQPSQNPPQNSTDAKGCVDQWVGMSQDCANSARSSERLCRRNQQDNADKNRDMNQMMALAKGVGGAYITSMSGSLQECFMGSVALNGAERLLRGQAQDCTADMESCKSSCNNLEPINAKSESCRQQIEALGAGTNGAAPTEQQLAAKREAEEYYRSKQSTVDRNLELGRSVCPASSSSNLLDESVNMLGKSLQTSLQCMCKLSTTTTAGTNCNTAVPAKTDCFMNPSTPGCQAYTALDKCTPGAGYDANACNCQLNPKSAGCPGGSGSGGLSNFGGGAINNGGSTAATFSGPKGGGDNIAGGSNLGDFGGDKPEGTGIAPPEENKVGQHHGGPLTAGGAGGGGAAGLGTGIASDGKDAVTEEEDKGVLGTLMNQAKSFTSKLGLGSGKNGDAKDNKRKLAFDPNKFRPIRGPSESKGFGRRNADIWKMVNVCYNAKTCASNRDGFITTP